MLSKEEIQIIKKFNKLEKQYEKLYEEVTNIIEREYEDFEAGDRIGDIIPKTEIPTMAQKNEGGTYSTCRQIGEDWGSGVIYIPLDNEDNEYLEIYYST